MVHCKENSVLLTNQLRRRSHTPERRREEYLRGIDISLISSVVLPPCELFTESNAISFIRKYHKTKPVKYKAFILPDKIVLHYKNRKLNTHPKPCINYSEVKYIFVSSSISTSGCFVLCIDSCTDRQCRYELYKIKDLETRNYFIDFLKSTTGVKARLHSNSNNSYCYQRHSVPHHSKALNSHRISSSSQDESESLFNYESSSSNFS
ncbi:unnamed protein product [Schistosoma turkestanicum]|nr:unnamed protein product [Schistosoma turkestanicum]